MAADGSGVKAPGPFRDITAASSLRRVARYTRRRITSRGLDGPKPRVTSANRIF
jgi:hypothetical protein